ncbi:transcription factor LUX-like [Punica granatum]|nr:transcription factor LUX-like [Punica granatum]
MGEEVKMTEYENGIEDDDEDDNSGGDDDRVLEWEAGLPAADDLTPLSQALISPELALAFSISPEPSRTLLDVNRASQTTLASLRGNSAQSQGFSTNNNFKSFAENRDPMAVDQDDVDRTDSRKSRRIESPEEADSALRADNSTDDPSARTLKRPRLVWTPQLHKRFVDVVAHLGIKNAVPKTIMQLMNVEGLTRENVASHLQKYRLYLKRMHGLSNEGPSSSDQLFASTPVPQSLHESGGAHSAHGNGHIPVPIPMSYGAPQMMSMPMYGMAHHGHMGMQMGNPGGSAPGYNGFDSNPYMMQQRDWLGNRYGSVVSYPESATPNDK